MDHRTRAYLNELAKALEYNDKSVAIGAAEQICTCPSCAEARANKGLSDCDKAQLARNVHDKVLGNMPGHCIPELSPNYFLFHSGKRRAF